MRSNVQTLVLLFVGVALAVIAYGRHPWNSMRIGGAVMGLLGLVFLFAARMQLGNSFTVHAEARKLVVTGLYSRIRHPVYILGSLTLAGLMLYLERPWYLLAFLVFVPLQIHRVREEEKILTEKFGDAYLLYKARTWF